MRGMKEKTEEGEGMEGKTKECLPRRGFGGRLFHMMI